MTQIKPYKNKDNVTRYYFNVYVVRNPKTGKNFYRKRQSFKTKKHAQIALAELLKEIEANGFDPASKEMTFKKLYDMWLKQHRMNVKPSMIATNRHFVESHVLPCFGTLEFLAITVVLSKNR